MSERELTAVEVLKTISEICVNDDSGCNQCPLWEVVCRHDGVEGLGHAKKVVEVCAKWHEEHHKPIETEQVWACRIYTVKPSGERLFQEEYIEPTYPSNKDIADILTEYARVHPLGDYTEYIATIEAVCRVKK